MESSKESIKLIASSEAWGAIAEHERRCALRQNRIEERLRTVELSLSRLTGFLVGSGILGGVAGGIASKLWGS